MNVLLVSNTNLGTCRKGNWGTQTSRSREDTAMALPAFITEGGLATFL